MQEEGRNTKVIMIENHGDLIDRDAFLKRMDRKIYRITVTTPDQEVVLHKDITYAEMFDCIMEEPVVVPSDKTIIISRGLAVPAENPWKAGHPRTKMWVLVRLEGGEYSFDYWEGRRWKNHDPERYATKKVVAWCDYVDPCKNAS